MMLPHSLSNPFSLDDPRDDFPPPPMHTEPIPPLRHYHNLFSSYLDPSHHLNTAPPPPLSNSWNTSGTSSAAPFPTLRNTSQLPQLPSPSFHAPPAASYNTGFASPRTHHAGFAPGLAPSLHYNSNNSGSSSSHPPSNLLELVNFDPRRLQDIVKRELCTTTADFNARIGLNLGGRTYFSTDDYALAAFGKRLRPDAPHAPLCQAEGCKSDLRIAKHYHRRHKVCEYHSKAATVIISGQKQRFCQQCSRFHVLAEFDDGKRSCRKRLADHNRRRRKTQLSPSTSLVSSTTHQPIEESEDGAGTHEGVGSKNSNPVDNPQAFPSAIPLTRASILPQTCKTPISQVCSDPKKDDLTDMQTSCKGPSLSLTTLGGGSHVQSTGESYDDIDSVPWLRQGNTRSDLIEAVTRCPKANMDKLGDSAGAQQCSTQNLLQLQDSRDHLANCSDWIMKNTAQEQLQDLGSPTLIRLDTKNSDGSSYRCDTMM